MQQWEPNWKLLKPMNYQAFFETGEARGRQSDLASPAIFRENKTGT